MTSSAWRTATAANDAPAHRVWLGLGTNLGDRAHNLARAIAALHGVVRLDALSGVYESEPFGHVEQPVFWNMVVRGRTRLAPAALLAAVKALEPVLGRVPSFPMGPRSIDIDILLYEDQVVDSDELKVPHPGLLERPFVLMPLLELDPDLRHPVTGETLAARADAGAPGLLRLGTASAVLPLEPADGV